MGGLCCQGQKVEDHITVVVHYPGDYGAYGMLELYLERAGAKKEPAPLASTEAFEIDRGVHEMKICLRPDLTLTHGGSRYSHLPNSDTSYNLTMEETGTFMIRGKKERRLNNLRLGDEIHIEVCDRHCG
mmetsp:Transcript_31795/g.74260  ORF Transcript_31795/g.74260 Transcript_31795/m.74260 type:complete len:129 (-) Transcript_31795:137-523(-)